MPPRRPRRDPSAVDDRSAEVVFDALARWIPPSSDDPLPDESLRALVGDVRRAMHRVELESARARRVPLARLVGQPAGRVVMAVRSRPETLTCAMVQRLCAESDRLRGHDMDAATDLARAAMALADLLGQEVPRPVVNDLRAKSRVRLANLLRLRSDYRRAKALLDEAAKLLERGSGDPLEIADVQRILAVTLKDEGRYSEALTLNGKAIAGFESCGEEKTVGRLLLDRAAILYELGRYLAMVGILARALACLDPEEEPRLFLMAVHGLAVSAFERGRLSHCHKLLSEVAWMYETVAGPSLRLRRLWLLAKIAIATDQSRAERLFCEVRDGFVELAQPTEVAHVSLEVALLYAEQGRQPELRSLAAETYRIFASRGMDAQALAPLALFRRAMCGQALTATMIRGAIAQMESRRGGDAHPPTTV